MATQQRSTSLVTAGLGLILFGAGVVGFLVVGFGVEATVDLLRQAMMAVLYVAVPVVVVAVMLRLSFTLSAWRG